MQLLKQTSDFNCGIFALDFLLKIHGIDIPIDFEPSEETGTSHQQIYDFLTENEISFGYEYNSQLEGIKCPAIINYQYEGDGHYSVILCKTPSYITLYNPDLGEIEVMSKNAFNRVWYSERYGSRWHLTIDR